MRHPNERVAVSTSKRALGTDRESKEQARLADTRVADQHQLEEVVTAIHSAVSFAAHGAKRTGGHGPELTSRA